MPQRTKEQKIKASLKKTLVDKPRQDNPTLNESGPQAYFSHDMTKSLIIILGIIALEFILYYGTINNHLSFIPKLGK